MAPASPFVSRAFLLIAVFLPSRFSATALQRFSVSLASAFMRSRSVTSSRSPSLFAMRPTFFVACWAAWARPSTSASLLSSCVICAMAARYPLCADGKARSARRALAGAEHRARRHSRAPGVRARGRLVAVGAHDRDRDRAAVRRHDEPVAVDLHDLARPRAGVAVDLLAVEDAAPGAVDRRPPAGPRVGPADEVVGLADRLAPVDLGVGLAAPAL